MANEWLVSWEEVSTRPGTSPMNIAPLLNDDSQKDFWTARRLRGAEEVCRTQYKALQAAQNDGLAIRALGLYESNIPIPEYTDMTAQALQVFAAKATLSSTKTLETNVSGPSSL